MKPYDAIKEKLSEYPQYRERKNKNEFIARMLKSKYKIELSLEDMTKVVIDVSTLDRNWRRVLEKNPHLQGADYFDKDRLEQEKIIELGYEGGANVKLDI